MEEQISQIKKWLGTGSVNLFGLPFAGKDTQGMILANLFGGVLISGGDVLRHAQQNQRVQELMASGEIIPSDLFEEIVVPFLSRDELAGKPLILSEVGRMKGEEQVIMRATDLSGHPTKAVILLKLSDEEVWRRFDASQQTHDRGDRADDNRDVLQKRLDRFHEKVEPVLAYYRSQGLLHEIDGSMTREQVTASIIDVLETTSNE